MLKKFLIGGAVLGGVVGIAFVAAVAMELYNDCKARGLDFDNENDANPDTQDASDAEADLSHLVECEESAEAEDLAKAIEDAVIIDN